MNIEIESKRVETFMAISRVVLCLLNLIIKHIFCVSLWFISFFLEVYFYCTAFGGTLLQAAFLDHPGPSDLPTPLLPLSLSLKLLPWLSPQLGFFSLAHMGIHKH